MLIYSLPPALVLLAWLMLAPPSSGSLSLPPPVQCNAQACTLSNYQGTWIDRTPCRASKAVYPASESELVDVVAEAVKEGIKMKVVTEIGHSLSKLACPDGEHGLLISMRDYVPDPIFVNKTEMTTTVDAGMQLRDFVRELAKFDLTVPHTPLWDGVSIGGVIATGSHGSGFFQKGSVISEYVSALRMVVPAPPERGYAKVINLCSTDEALKAAKISLGVLGVVSKVTFSVMPMFKRSLTLNLAGDEDLEVRMLSFSKSHAFASLFWIPSTGKVLYKEENVAPIETEGDGANMFPLVQPMLASQIEAMRAHQEAVEEARNVAGLCLSGERMVEHRMKSGDGYVNSVGGSFQGFPVVGFNHRMQTVGGCQVYQPLTPATAVVAKGNMSDWWTCKWDPRVRGIFYHHTAVAIPFANVAEFVKDVKRLREENPEGMCSLNMFGGIHVRFVTRSDAYLGDKVDSAVLELVYFRARDRGQPRLNEDVMEELEQMMVLKHKGKPHWGKNRNVAFQGAWEKVVDVSRFLRVKAELDPDGLFSSAWSDELLGLHETASRADDDHCALEGLCFCRHDRHCAPQVGYTCERGLVFEQARVCRFSPPAASS